jgi:hypothetical protein
MLTKEEREFMDLYVREEYTHDYYGYAQALTKGMGITYDHFARMYPFYVEAWKPLGGLQEVLPPLPDNPTPPCPWSSKEEMEARLVELESLVHSE